MKINFILFSLLIFFSSCDRTFIAFTEPQPKGIPAVKKFEKTAYGVYIHKASKESENNVHAETEITLRIDKKIIVRNYAILLRYLKTDSSSHIREVEPILRSLDSLSRVNSSTYFCRLESVGDTMKFYYNSRNSDTMYFKSPDYIIKKYNALYYLNKRLPENVWNVKQLEFTSGKLILGTLEEKDKEILNQYTEVKEREPDNLFEDPKGLGEGISNTIFQALDNAMHYSNIADPDKDAFDKFVESGGFTSKMEFVKKE